MTLLLIATEAELTLVGFLETSFFLVWWDGVGFFMGGFLQRIRSIADLAPPKAPRSGGAHAVPVEPVITCSSNASFPAELEVFLRMCPSTRGLSSPTPCYS